MKEKLFSHGNFRATKIYAGSIRNPRTGVNDNKSVGLKIDDPRQVRSLIFRLGRYLVWDSLRILRGKNHSPVLITSFKYNKGPSGHVTTVTSSAKP